VTNDAGEKTAVMVSWPFGAENESASNLGDGVDDLRFTGHEKVNDASGFDLYYVHARSQMARKGRFLTVDPVLDFNRAMTKPQGWNRYAYVENNPVALTDPTGKVIGIDDAIELIAIGYVLASDPVKSQEIINTIVGVGGVA